MINSYEEAAVCVVKVLSVVSWCFIIVHQTNRKTKSAGYTKAISRVRVKTYLNLAEIYNNGNTKL